MTSDRKMEALRRLAERPGTEAEGKLAREILERLEAKATDGFDEDFAWSKFKDFLRTGSLDDLIAATGKWSMCACGTRYPRMGSCPATDIHERVRAEMRQRFPVGTRVFYNKWAYAANFPGAVKGYPVDWNWCRIKFDAYSRARNVPVYTEKGWHISEEPVDEQFLAENGLRGGMENIERMEQKIADQYR